MTNIVIRLGGASIEEGDLTFAKPMRRAIIDRVIFREFIEGRDVYLLRLNMGTPDKQEVYLVSQERKHNDHEFEG